MNGTDRHLRDLLEAAVGEPPHRVSAEAVHRRVIRRRMVEFAAGAVAVAVLAVIAPSGHRGTWPWTRAINHRARCGPPCHLPALRLHRGAPRPLAAHQAGNPPVEWAGWPRLRHQRGGPFPRAGRRPGLGDPPSQRSRVCLPFTARTIRHARAAHPCSPTQTNQTITIGGAPARLRGHAMPGRQRLPGRDRGHRPPWHRVRVHIPELVGGHLAHRPSPATAPPSANS